MSVDRGVLGGISNDSGGHLVESKHRFNEAPANSGKVQMLGTSICEAARASIAQCARGDGKKVAQFPDDDIGITRFDQHP